MAAGRASETRRLDEVGPPRMSAGAAGVGAREPPGVLAERRPDSARRTGGSRSRSGSRSRGPSAARTGRLSESWADVRHRSVQHGVGVSRAGLLLAPAAGLLMTNMLLGMVWVVTGALTARRIALLVAGGSAVFAFLPYSFETMGLDVRILLIANVPALGVGWALAHYTPPRNRAPSRRGRHHGIPAGHGAVAGCPGRAGPDAGVGRLLGLG